MVDAVIRFLISVVLIAALVWLCIWVLGAMGIMIPIMVERCLEILAVLVILLVAWRTFGGYLGGPWIPPPRA